MGEAHHWRDLRRTKSESHVVDADLLKLLEVAGEIVRGPRQSRTTIWRDPGSRCIAELGTSWRALRRRRPPVRGLLRESCHSGAERKRERLVSESSLLPHGQDLITGAPIFGSWQP